MAPCALIFRRSQMNHPCLALQTDGEHTVCAKFCPRLFKKLEVNDENLSMF